MIKTGIYYAYWTSDWDADFIPFVGKVRELGFDVLEVNAGTIASMKKDKRTLLRIAAADAGIDLSCCIGLPPESDIASEHESVRRAGIRHLGRIADSMVDCGIGKLSGIIYSCWPGTPAGRRAGRQESLDYSVASMREAIKKAEDLGLQYNIEIVNRFEQFLLNTAREGVEYCRRVDSPNLKILLDTFHMNIEEDSMESAIADTAGLLGHFHLGENNRRPPGRGKFPWKDIFGALKSIGYSGWVVMEPFLSPGGEVGRDISVHRSIIPGADLDMEALRSCRFVNEIVSDVFGTV